MPMTTATPSHQVASGHSGIKRHEKQQRHGGSVALMA